MTPERFGMGEYVFILEFNLIPCLNASKTIFGNNYMIKNGNSYNFTRSDKLVSNLHIFLARHSHSGRMIVRKDNGRSAVLDRRTKHFARMHHACGESADRNYFIVNNPIMTIQIEPAEMLLRQTMHVF